MCSFQSTRLSIKAVLFSALLVLGHVSLTTIATQDIPREKLGATRTVSSWLFLTLLWIGFTLLESVDVGSEDTKQRVFSKTWVEGTLGLILLGGWVGCAWTGEKLVKGMILDPVDFAFIGVSYLVIVGALAGLLLQIAVPAMREGSRAEVWSSATGDWGRIKLPGEKAQTGDGEKEDV
ncbi:hypothetical protein P7C73_g5893, partial [Tremellales sp. Uapishka_1]